MMNRRVKIEECNIETRNDEDRMIVDILKVDIRWQSKNFKSILLLLCKNRV